jgi:valyl-tRNA synthetase
LRIKDANPETRRRMDAHRDLIVRLARLSSLSVATGPVPAGALQAVLDEATLILPVADLIDIAAERARLAKEIDKLAGEVQKIDQKLGNPSFVSRAPAEVVEEQRERRSDAEAARAKLAEALARLQAG